MEGSVQETREHTAQTRITEDLKKELEMIVDNMLDQLGEKKYSNPSHFIRIAIQDKIKAEKLETVRIIKLKEQILKKYDGNTY